MWKDKKHSITDQFMVQSSVKQTKNMDSQMINNQHKSKLSSIISKRTSNTDVELFVQDNHLILKPTVSNINLLGYQYPDVRLFTPPVYQDENEMDEWIEHQKEILDATLHAFNGNAHVINWTMGPTVTQFQVSLSLGVKVNKITKLTDNLKWVLAAKDILIKVPIPGRTIVRIEIPNLNTRPVMFSEVIQSETF